jgi:hypothetical protein
LKILYRGLEEWHLFQNLKTSEIPNISGPSVSYKESTLWVIGKSLALKILELNQVWWYTPIILAAQEVGLGGSWFKASPGKKFAKPPSQPIKAGHDGTDLSSQLGGKCK